MITLGFTLSREAGLVYTKERNILTGFCFRMLVGAAVASAVLWGADGAARISVVRPDARTGKLVRSVVVSSRPVPERTVAETVVTPHLPAPPPAPAAPAATSAPPLPGVPELVAQIAARHSLPPELVDSVIQVESNYNPYAVSPKGAQGLMQLIPATARRFGVSDVFDPADNIQGGVRYLKYLLDLYGGNYRLALAAYNAGEGAVARHGGVPPYRETERYVKLVGQHVEDAMKASAAAQSKAVQEVKPAPAGGVSHIRAVTETDGTVRYVSR